MAGAPRSRRGGKNGRSDGAGLARRRPPRSLADLSSPIRRLRSLRSRRSAALRSIPASKPRPDVLVLAIKPQSLDPAAPQIAALAAERTLVFSIIAGKTIANLTARPPQARAVVRAMPNTPAAIGRGVTAAFANADVKRRSGAGASAARRGRRVLLAGGRRRDRRRDRDLRLGPGLCVRPRRGARRSGGETGPAAELRWASRGAPLRARRTDAPRKRDPAATLRQNVTSPGGTTAAALAVLKDAQGLDDLMARATAAARARAAEMAG